MGGRLPTAWAQEELFVTNTFANSITVYTRTASGNTGPLRTLSGPATGLSIPSGLAVDPLHNELVVADSSGSSITAYTRTATGLAPSAPLESALLITLPAGAYTAIVSGFGGSTGVGFVEVFEVPGT